MKIKLNSEDWKKVLTGATIATTGALLAYLSETLSGYDFGSLSPLVSAAFAVLTNIVRKWHKNLAEPAE